MAITITESGRLVVTIGRRGVPGVGVIAGGTTGQVLSKASATDYDMEWSAAGSGDMASAVYDPTSVAGDAFDMENMAEGATNKILSSAERTQLTALTGLTGGTTGQIATKASGDDYDLTWADDLTVPGLLTANHIHGNIAGTLYVHVKNTSGGTLAKGTPVYVTGHVGSSDRVEVAAADQSDPAKMPAIALLADELANNGEGDGVIVGEIRTYDTDTPGWALNDELFVGTGALTATKPTTGAVQPVATVGRLQASTGVLVINCQGQRSPDETFAPALGADENYVTDAEKVVIGNTSGTNTGDQDLSGYALTSSLGTAASLDVGTSANQIVQLNASSELPAVSGANLTNLPSGATQLSDLSDVGTTTATSGNVLVGNGSLFASRPLTESDISDLGTYLTDITGEALSDLDTTVTGAQLNTIKTTVDGLSAVATSGSYDDLSEKPTIPAPVDELTDLDTTVTGAQLDTIKSTVDGLGTAASLDVGTSANQIVQLNGSAELPAVSGANLTNLPSGATQLSDLSDVGSTTATNRNVLVADGDSWESRALTEADISDLGTYLTSVAAADISDATADGIALITSADANPFTDAEKTLLGNQSGTNTGDEIDATTSAKGIVELATDGESSAGVVVQGNDSRLSPPGQITIRINSPSVGVAGYTRIPKGLSIDSATIHASASCSAVVDLWVDSISTNPIADVTDADSITASAQPTLSSATYSTDATLTGWTTSLTEGDYIAANVDSVSGAPAWVEVILQTTPA